MASQDYGFVDEILNGEDGNPRKIEGQLSFPAEGDGPFPAVVIMHSSLGRDAQVWMYVRRLNDMGFATLAIDSFTDRGITEIEYDQTVVSEASMVADAFAGLEMLADDRRIDSHRIGVMGFSKGALPAMFASNLRLADALSPRGERFAFHIAYYPWCGVRFQDPRTTGAPVLIVTGDQDDITPPELCRDLIDDMQAYDPQVPMELDVIPDALHAFDHPRLAYLPPVRLNFLVPNECFIEEVSPGEFIEETNNAPVTGDTMSEVLGACSSDGFMAGGNRRAARAAWFRTATELRPFTYRRVAQISE